jgi:transposase
MAERRSEGVKLLKVGERRQAEIARHLGVTEAAVSKWKKILDTEGEEGLQPKRATGRPPKLSEEQKAALLEKLEEGAVANGFPTEQWTQARVKKLIERAYGVSYRRNYVGQLLDQLGWSVQKPDPRAMERDEEMIAAWLSKDWPRIKKSAAARRRNRF